MCDGRSVLLCIIATGAGWTDLRRGKVYNWWLLAGTAAGICCRGNRFFLPAALVLLPAFALFRCRMMGAGDGKLMALIAGYLGFWNGMEAIAAGFAVGAVWSLHRLWCEGSFRARLRFMSVYFMRVIQEKEVIAYDAGTPDTRSRIPLAVCLAAGVWLYQAGVWAAEVKGGIG